MGVEYRAIDWFDWLPPHLYRVGDDGSVWRWLAGCKRNKLRHPSRWKEVKGRAGGDRGYMVLLCGDVQKRVSIAALVCRAFYGPRPIGCVAIRIGRDPKSCRLHDVRWAPRGTELLGVSRPYNGRGAEHNGSKLTDGDVLDIRKRASDGDHISDIANVFGVGVSTIGFIVRGQTWAHLPGAIPLYRGKTLRGEDNPSSILNVDDVRKIRRMARFGISCRRIADRFGVSWDCVKNAVTGKTWKHVPMEQGTNGDGEGGGE
jgi:hypothetical protein